MEKKKEKKGFWLWFANEMYKEVSSFVKEKARLLLILPGLFIVLFIFPYLYPTNRPVKQKVKILLLKNTTANIHQNKKVFSIKSWVYQVHWFRELSFFFLVIWALKISLKKGEWKEECRVWCLIIQMWDSMWHFQRPQRSPVWWIPIYKKKKIELVSQVLIKDGANAFNVFLDDKLLMILKTTKEKEEYLVCDKMSQKEHTLSISRRSERNLPKTFLTLKTSEPSKKALYGMTHFKGIIADETIQFVYVEKMAKKERRIEFIGDSITCGWAKKDFCVRIAL